MAGCVCCGNQDRDLRAGVCFDCATEGEGRAAKRSVLAHLASAVRNTVAGCFDHARIDLKWAIERATRSGDYAPGGIFETDYPGCLK